MISAEQMRQIAELPAETDFRFRRRADGQTIVAVHWPSMSRMMYIDEDGGRLLFSDSGNVYSWSKVKMRIGDGFD